MGPDDDRDALVVRENVARVDLGDVAVLHATGADRIGFLHRLTSGTVDEELIGSALYGPRSAERLRDLGVLVPEGLAVEGAHAEVAGPGGVLWLVRTGGLGAQGLWVFGKPEASAALAAALDAAGVPTLAPDVVQALRIEAGEPRAGAEITGDTFPMEVGLASALDQKKGCYLGQETIVRVRDRGLVRRRLVGLRLTDDGLPSAGEEIAFEQNPAAGRVTSVGRMPGRRAVALALLATAVPVGADVQLKHGEASLAARVTFERPPWG